jgi:amino acid adenylation domain-containing protein
MLAVMKAGAASVALDPNQPEARLRAIARQVSPTVIIASDTKEELAQRLGNCTVVALNSSFFDSFNPPARTRLPLVALSSTLSIVFTSGSTGTPKGVVITHSNFAATILHHTNVFGIDATSRVYDFAAYSFDFAWSNLILTLAAGGCICIPSEEERKSDLVSSIKRLNANFMFTTPSVARILDPTELKTLKTLAVGGEASQKTDFNDWPSSIRIVNVYGPTECTVMSTSADIKSQGNRDLGIGYGTGTNTWVVNPRNNSYLAPIGAVGELWIEGPLVTQGYLNDPDKTALVFVEDPTWLLQGAPGHLGRRGRLYKTGDLVRYNTDGSLAFAGRKDNQVKIRGQRVELDEVEYHVRNCLAYDGADKDNYISRMQIVAEVIMPLDGASPTLVVFVKASKDKTTSAQTNFINSCLREMTTGIEDRLAGRIPIYMIPSAYIPLESLPMTSTGKADRRQLRAIGHSMTLEQLNIKTAYKTQMQAPTTDMQRWLQSSWATILHQDAASISINDNFFHRGGDSISAMRLAGAARKLGISISVVDIFQHPHLANLATRCEKFGYVTSSDALPFASLHVSQPEVFVKNEVYPSLKEPNCKILDVLPLSRFQKICVGHDMQPNYGCGFHFYIDCPQSLDLKQLLSSCSKLIQHFDILRTIFVQSSNGLLQVVLDSLQPTVDFHDSEDSIEILFNRVCSDDLKQSAVLGRSFLRFMILRASNNARRLVLRLSHAQYDGICLAQIVAALGAFYNEEPVPQARSYANYIDHISRHDETDFSFWQTILAGSQMTSLPGKQSSASLEEENSPIRVEKAIPLMKSHHGATSATVFTVACAIMLGRVTRSNDVVFGRLVAGRAGLPSDIQDIVGPCVNIVPVRVKLDDGLTLSAMFAALQRQCIDATPHETVSLEEIKENCVEWPENVTNFGCCTHFRNIDEQPGTEMAGDTFNLGTFHREDLPPDFDAIDIGAVPVDGAMRLIIGANSKYFSSELIFHMHNVLCTVLTEFNDDSLGGSQTKQFAKAE